MTITAFVQEDTTHTYTAKDGQQKTVRQLNLFDMDPGPHRVTKNIGMRIPIESGAPSPAMRGRNVTIAVKGISQFEWNKELGFDGVLIEGGEQKK